MLQEPVEAVATPQTDVNMADATGENLNDIQSILGMIMLICLCIMRNTRVMSMTKSQIFELNEYLFIL